MRILNHLSQSPKTGGRHARSTKRDARERSLTAALSGSGNLPVSSITNIRPLLASGPFFFLPSSCPRLALVLPLSLNVAIEHEQLAMQKCRRTGRCLNASLGRVSLPRLHNGSARPLLDQLHPFKVRQSRNRGIPPVRPVNQESFAGQQFFVDE